jgi:hypothetical protein
MAGAEKRLPFLPTAKNSSAKDLSQDALLVGKRSSFSPHPPPPLNLWNHRVSSENVRKISSAKELEAKSLKQRS